MREIEHARFTLALTNIELAKSSYSDPIHAQRLAEFNQAMVELPKGIGMRRKQWTREAEIIL